MVVAQDRRIAAWATEHDLPFVESHQELTPALEGRAFDHLLSITNLAVLPDELLSLPSRSAINFHDGPLPRYAGLNAPAWALINGETEYGVTFHEMTAQVDAGRILGQKHFPISPGETSLSLNTKCFEAGIEGFEDLIHGLEADRLVPRAQAAGPESYFGRLDRPEAVCLLSPARPAEELERLVRALDFGPYENPLGTAKLMNGTRGLLVQAARAVPAEGELEPGRLQIQDDTRLRLGTGEGELELTRIADPSGHPLTPEQALAALGLEEPGGELEFDPTSLERLAEATRPLARRESFWRKRLARLEALDLPYLHSERADQTQPTWLSHAVEVPPLLAERFGSHSDANVLTAGVASYLSRISGQSRFDLGFRVAEPLRELQPWVSEWVPLRASVDREAPTGSFVASLSDELQRVRDRGTWLTDALSRFPDLARFDSASLVKIALQIGDAETRTVPGEMLILIAEAGDRLELRIDARLVEPDDAERMARQLEHHLRSLAECDPERALSAVPLLAPEERRQILQDWNRTEAPYPREATIPSLFAAQVQRNPGATALICRDEILSYADLDARSSRLAHHLRERGVGPDDLVGVYCERSFDMMIATLAVMKAGGAYVPLDPHYPADRIALMIEDSGASILLTQAALVASLPRSSASVIVVDSPSPAWADAPADAPRPSAGPEHLAYVIYTSGSTGRPKGVMVEHRNVVNFFAGMDETVRHDPPGTWMAVTSLSFDISALELFYTLCRGFEVVLHAEYPGKSETDPIGEIDFGLFMWGADDTQSDSKYELMLESARFGDRAGFSSFWTPERHFHAFGGPYPNPAITGAAVAAVTERIAIRAGSCVLPLHHPIRVAEEWAAVDNLSGGRVGVSFAAGWQPNDFVIRPDSFKEAKTNMFRDVATVQALWRGESVEFEGPTGARVATRTQPRPVQSELPTWITTAGNVETFRMAGESGAHLLTHLLGQTLEEVAEKIRVYRDARAEAGFDPDEGIVTLMLHTLVGDDDDEVRRIAREPMKGYLRSSANLLQGFAWAFPAFRKPAGGDGAPDELDLDTLESEELDTILDFAFERYFETSGLFGSVERCLATVARLKAAGVNEIGCLIDYGVDTDVMLASLEKLDEVRRRSQPTPSATDAADHEVTREDQSLAAQILRHEVTHLQCTPSMARMLVMDRDAHGALAQLEHLMIGGEAFPVSLAHDLDRIATGRVTNMYGPTETTIWSSTSGISGTPARIDIGRPISNTRLYIVDDHLEPVPIGVPGELLIGGDGVVRGYLDRPELTAERFIPDPFTKDGAGRLYRTGDQARFLSDGTVDFLGRMDHQIKIRGYRVELGEIESRLAEQAGIAECVAIVREDTPGDQRLVAYAVASGAKPDPEDLKRSLSRSLPEFMVPSLIHFLSALPLTPNGKVDRKALPDPEIQRPRQATEFVAPAGDLERMISEVWKSVLHLEEVGSHDNFFDLGGHSLLVVQTHRALRDQVPRSLSLTDLYRFPTIHTLADHLGRESEDSASRAGQDRAEKRRSARARRRRPSAK